MNIRFGTTEAPANALPIGKEASVAVWESRPGPFPFYTCKF